MPCFVSAPDKISYDQGHPLEDPIGDCSVRDICKRMLFISVEDLLCAALFVIKQVE
jgi:hypothetical protein